MINFNKIMYFCVIPGIRTNFVMNFNKMIYVCLQTSDLWNIYEPSSVLFGSSIFYLCIVAKVIAEPSMEFANANSLIVWLGKNWCCSETTLVYLIIVLHGLLFFVNFQYSSSGTDEMGKISIKVTSFIICARCRFSKW